MNGRRCRRNKIKTTKKYKNSNKGEKNRWQRPPRLLVLRQANIKTNNNNMKWWQPEPEGRATANKKKLIIVIQLITSKIFSQIKMKLFSSVLFYFATPTRPTNINTHPKLWSHRTTFFFNFNSFIFNLDVEKFIYIYTQNHKKSNNKKSILHLRTIIN